MAALGKCLPWTCSKTVPVAQRPGVSMISGLALLLKVSTPGVMGAALGSQGAGTAPDPCGTRRGC